MKALLFALITLSGAAQAAEFEVQLDDTRHTWSSEELLNHPQARDIEVSDDVSYKRSMQYRAVPISALLDGVTPGDHLQAVALDGFAAELPAAILLASEGAKAWLAIEDPQHPWPPRPPASPAPGPSTWSGSTRLPARSALSSGHFRLPGFASWRLSSSASLPCSRPTMQAPRCRRVSPCSRRTAWPATVSTARATPSSALI